MKELIKRLRVGDDETTGALEQQIEELAAALEMKDACIKRMKLAEDGEAWNIRAEMLAIQPHASILNKIRADAVRKIGTLFSSEGINFSVFRQIALDYADRIEKGEA